MMEIIYYNFASEIPCELWNSCFPAPLEGKWWYEALEKSELQSQFQFFYGVVLENDIPVAIAPIFVMNVPISQVIPDGMLPIFNALGKIIPSLLYQRTFFIGSPCSDEGTVGHIAGADSYKLLLFLQKELSKKARKLNCPMFVWKDFPNSYRADLSKIAKENWLFKLVSFPETIVDFPQANIESYFASLKGSHRHNLKKKLRRSGQQVEIYSEVLQNPDSEILDEVFALFNQTYEKATTKFEELNRLFFTNIAQSPVSHFVILREKNSGEMLAFMLCFLFPKRVINKFIGIDYNRPKEWFLYFRLWEEAVKWTVAQRICQIQSGQTGYRPKLDTGHKLVELTNYCRHQNPIIHLIYKIFAKTVSWNSLDNSLEIYSKSQKNADSGND